jgi:hypothetical protein
MTPLIHGVALSRVPQAPSPVLLALEDTAEGGCAGKNKNGSADHILACLNRSTCDLLAEPDHVDRIVLYQKA